jgi:hypothetical protein
VGASVGPIADVAGQHLGPFFGMGAEEMLTAVDRESVQPFIGRSWNQRERLRSREFSRTYLSLESALIGTKLG